MIQLFCLCTWFIFGETQPSWQVVADAERAFAASAKATSINEAFRKWLADDGILFRPTAVNAQTFLKSKTPNKKQLLWQPNIAVISRDRSMGLSTGPYVFRGKPEDAGSYGHFISVWGKQANGEWRVLIDAGTPHDPIPEADWPQDLPSIEEAASDIELIRYVEDYKGQCFSWSDRGALAVG